VLVSADYTGESDLTRALAALALLRWTPGTAAAAPLLSALESNQASDGSFGQDPYTTALALHACAALLGTDSPTLQAAIYIPDHGLRQAINQALGKSMASATVTRSRPPLSLSMPSPRVATQHTGRRSSRAAKATAKYSG